MSAVTRLHLGRVYGGLSGCTLECDAFDVGEGVSLAKTFARVMAPVVLAVAASKENNQLAAPWTPVGPGATVDLQVQIEVPSLIDLPEDTFDNLNTVWFITALLRLRTAAPIRVPVVADRPIAEIGRANDKPLTVPILMEMEPRWAPVVERKTVISSEVLEWLRSAWPRTRRLLHANQRVNEAFQAFDEAPSLRSTSVSLLVLWGALEHLFMYERGELSLRASGRIAAYLEPYGAGRRALQRRVVKLYDARSKAAHSVGADVAPEFGETLELLRRIFLRIVNDGELPGRDGLDDLVFGSAERGDV